MNDLLSAFPHWSTRLEELRDLQKKVAKDPTVESVHRLRILTRRLRAILWLARESRSTRAMDQAKKGLRLLGRALGARRELDMGLHYARLYGRESHRYETAYDDANQDLRKALNRKSVRQLSDRLKKISSAMEKIPLKKAIEPLEGLKRDLILTPKALPKTTEERHDLRIRMKKIRYLLEELDAKEPVVKQLQDHLGTEHDLFLMGLLKAANRERRKASRIVRPAIVGAIRRLTEVESQFLS